MINCKILIIDSHPVYMDKMIGFLRGLTFKDIYSASTGGRGIELVRVENPKLIIMSASLPDMDSLEVCKVIQKQTYGSVKIIVQTGLFVPEESIEQFKKYGANAVLPRKEKDLTLLQNTIEKLFLSVLKT
ncbi:hypothetical protein MNBD_BACTEROID05-337 [hydrothermal vent metagenome]|uniref:Response regulatory domain-containing protein n=1 Tax=hydrothermal vent metagenome TaxID=652676 RepID=A0A3B0TXF3_9ZZZZ